MLSHVIEIFMLLWKFLLLMAQDNSFQMPKNNTLVVISNYNQGIINIFVKNYISYLVFIR